MQLKRDVLLEPALAPVPGRPQLSRFFVFRAWKTHWACGVAKAHELAHHTLGPSRLPGDTGSVFRVLPARHARDGAEAVAGPGTSRSLVAALRLRHLRRRGYHPPAHP